MTGVITAPGVPPIDGPLRKQLTEYGVGILLGIGCGFAVLCQAANYLATSHGDRAAFRTLVVGVSVLTVAHTICSMADFLIVMCRNFGNASVFFSYSPIYSTLFVLDGLIAGTIQAFYGWRVWSLQGQRTWLIPLFALLVGFTVGTWTYMGITVQLPEDEEYFTPTGAIVTFIAPVVGDLVITGFMLLSIHRAKERSIGLTRAEERLQMAQANCFADRHYQCPYFSFLGGEVSIFTSADGQPWAGVNILLPILPHVYFATLLTWLFAKKPASQSTYNLSGSDPTRTTTVGESIKLERKPSYRGQIASGIKVDVSQVDYWDENTHESHVKRHSLDLKGTSSAEQSQRESEESEGREMHPFGAKCAAKRQSSPVSPV